MISSLANFINEAANYWPILLDAALKSTLWLIVAMSVLFVTRPRSANLRHALSVAAALGCALVFVLSLSPLPALVGFNLAEHAYIEVVAETPSSIAIRRDNAPESPAAVPSIPAASREPAKPPFNPFGVATFFWLLGALSFALLFLFRCRRRILPLNAQHAAPDHPVTLLVEQETSSIELKRAPVLLLADNAMPMTFGLVTPQLLLPSDAESWSEEKLRAIVRHELAHIRRQDILSSCVIELALLPLWWNPFAWILKRKATEWREQACDNAVLTQGHEAADYGDYLLSLIPQSGLIRQPGLALPAINPTGRVKRFRQLLNPSVSRSNVTPARLAFLSVVTLIGSLFLGGGLTSIAEEKEAPKETLGDLAAPTTGKRYPAPPPVNQDSKHLRIRIQLFETTIHDESDPLLAEWRENGVSILSREEGALFFNPNRAGTDILAVPSLLTPPGQAATISMGKKIPYRVKGNSPADKNPDGDTAEGIPGNRESVETGIEIAINLQPTDDPTQLQGEIKAKVSELIGYAEPEEGESFERPLLSTYKINTTATFVNGSYFIIGEKEDIVSVEDHVPFLGNIPAIGKLFREEWTQHEKRLIGMMIWVEPVDLRGERIHPDPHPPEFQKEGAEKKAASLP